ncbi:hypothetical protein MN210_01365 [Psychrobacter raelei]|uniref:Uncharacterized protein n=3 Tax=Psychrobacter TaxID=497 RepID=A0A379LN14_9GAMM|nr:hypothetical protein [Psychrobacter phenylpyruvicus]SUD91841.1 Uncharacterised protein [Psychrobacter phenylpyruvicus]
MLTLLAENGCNEAKKECFDTILKLWEKRAVMPQGYRPFKSFESLMNVLDSLKIENRPRYEISKIIDECSYKVNNDSPENQWLESVKFVDDSAKQLINYCLEQAIKEAVDDETKEWLQTLQDIPFDNEILEFINFYSDEETDEEKYTENLIKKIRQIKDLELLCQKVSEDIKKFGGGSKSRLTLDI